VEKIVEQAKVVIEKWDKVWKPLRGEQAYSQLQVMVE